MVELLTVEEPGEYKKESWAMDIDEKLNALPQLRVEGNRLYTEKNFQAASEKYGEALGMLEQLVLRWVLFDIDHTTKTHLIGIYLAIFRVLYMCCDIPTLHVWASCLSEV